MGGLENGEPPLKRVKVPSSDSEKLDKSSGIVSVSACLGESMARPFSSQGDGEMVGSKGVIKKHEFVKIITRTLYSLGYDKSGAILQEESGISLHSSTVNLFLQQVLDGKWDESSSTLHRIGLSDESILKSASFFILEQKFFELLREEKFMDALSTLRNEIIPLSVNIDRVHELASCIISSSHCVEVGIFGQDGAGTNSRSRLLEKLQKLLPATIMIPERRLERLVEQALDVQRDACVFHNALDSDMSLYSDHFCGKNQIPSQTLQILWAHQDEVWFLQFSHNGKYLASSSKDQSAVVWEVKETSEVLLKHTLTGHKKPVSTISWSPDDCQLLTCGEEEVIRRWDVNSGKCLHVYEAGVGLISCGWLPNGNTIVAGMTDKSICLWDLDGREVECWRGQRIVNVSDMAVTDNGKMVISICRETVIQLLDREANVARFIEEEEWITSFSLSKDSKFLLVNLMNQEIHLWNIEGDPAIISKYKGHQHTRFLIRSCFGGLEQTFIASGSEDSQVYIWYRSTGELILTLPGHSGAVNCVSWNPVNPHMLASASDDRTIRIWGLNDLKCRITHRNDIAHHSNGRTCGL